MPVLVVAAAALGGWYLVRLWNGSKGPDVAKRAGDVLRVAGKAFVAALALGALAAMAQGCDGTEPAPGGSGGDQPQYERCPAFHEEDCPPAVPGSP